MSSWASRNLRYQKKIVSKPVEEIPYDNKPKQLSKEEVITLTKKSYKRITIQPINVLFISNIQSGGTKKYIDDIIYNFKSNYINFQRITSREQLLSYPNNNQMTLNDIIFFQHLINTDLEMDDIINFKKTYNCKLVLTLHDFYLLKDDYQHYNPILHSLYLEDVKPIEKHQILLDIVDDIVAPSEFVLNNIKNIYKIKFYFY